MSHSFLVGVGGITMKNILTSPRGPTMPTIQKLYLVSLGKCISDLAFSCGFGGTLSLSFKIQGSHSYFFYLAVIDLVDVRTSHRTSNHLNFPDEETWYI